MYDVALWPVLAAGISNVIIGMIWYNPKVFGDVWMKLTNLSPAMMEAGKKKMPIMAFMAMLAAIVMSYVMAHFAIAWGVFDVIGAIELAFWLWVGFVVPPALGVVFWEGKSFKLFAINAGYWFVSMTVASVILVSSISG
jgi:hypothetical protein